MVKNSDTNPSRSCYNCNQTVGLGHRFCPHCGQANHPTKLTIGILVKDFVDNFFNLDSKFFKTLFHIYSPTYLTREYLAGRRVKYANPIRLFAISIVILFAILAVFLNKKIKFGGIENVSENLTSSTTKAKMLDTYDLLIDSMNLSNTQIEVTDSIRKKLFKGVTHLDSTYVDFDINFSFKGEPKDYKFLSDDVMNMDPDSLLVKYNITEFTEKVFLKQWIKAYTNGPDTIRFIIGNMLWVIVLTILLSALILKILYVRHKMFYIEHVILLCNIHSLLFILIILALGSGIWWPTGNQIASLILSFYWIFILFAFKKYYQQGLFKTFIKFLFFVFTYGFVMIFCSIFVVLISFLLF
jgi:hypothetical protein